MHLLTVILAPGSVGHIANIVKGYAIAVGVAFAVYMVWRWWTTRLREAQTDRAARARSVWARHLSLALAYPELADPASAGGAVADEARYRSFVASLLVASDEILGLDPSETWRDTLARHIARHRAWLATAEFAETTLADCSEPTRALVKRVTV